MWNTFESFLLTQPACSVSEWTARYEAALKIAARDKLPNRPGRSYPLRAHPRRPESTKFMKQEAEKTKTKIHHPKSQSECDWPIAAGGKSSGRLASRLQHRAVHKDNDWKRLENHWKVVRREVDHPKPVILKPLQFQNWGAIGCVQIKWDNVVHDCVGGIFQGGSSGQWRVLTVRVPARRLPKMFERQTGHVKLSVGMDDPANFGPVLIHGFPFVNHYASPAPQANSMNAWNLMLLNQVNQLREIRNLCFRKRVIGRWMRIWRTEVRSVCDG